MSEEGGESLSTGLKPQGTSPPKALQVLWRGSRPPLTALVVVSLPPPEVWAPAWSWPLLGPFHKHVLKHAGLPPSGSLSPASQKPVLHVTTGVGQGVAEQTCLSALW